MVPVVGWNTVQDDLASVLKMKHPKPFQGTGKLKYFKLHLHVDPNVPPIYNLTLNGEKCTFRMNKIVFMRILLSQHGVGPTEEKVWAVKDASRPTTPSEVRSFLGLSVFSSRFIPDFATIAEPLRALTRNGVKFEWTEVQEKKLCKQ